MPVPAQRALPRAALALTAGLLSPGVGRTAPAAPAAMAAFHQNVEPLLVQYCYDCHADGESKGNVAFDDLGSDQDLLANTKLWSAALKNVRAGLMPADGPKPTAAEIDRLAQWIKQDAFGLDPANPDPGRVTVRRLNRAEYTNTVRDLMGVEFSAESTFPPDDTGRGFDNNADVLSISPLLLEKYLQAADTIVKKAVPVVSAVVLTRVSPGQDFRLTDGEGDGRVLDVFKAATTARTFAITQDETYRLVIDLQVNGSFDFSPGHARLIGRLDGRQLFTADVRWGERQPLHYEYTEHWTAGEHEVTFELQPLDPVAQPVASAPPPRPAEPAKPAPSDAPSASVAVAAGAPPPAAGARRGQGPPRPAPTLTVRVDSVRLDGPLPERYWVPPANHARFFPKGAAPAEPAARLAYAREVLGAFATRAFRRPVEDAKIDQLAALARATYDQPGKTFEQGVARAMLAVLASPRFLFRIEQTEPVPPGATAAPLDEYALASRLSYFLWSSMPDRTLFDLAAAGRLRRELPAQVDRMLKDNRSQNLVKNFVGQWLQARDIESVPINGRAVLGITRGPNNAASASDFSATIRKAMHRETELYFEHVMREDCSVLEFIDSDYTYLNDVLATHYGIPDVTGSNLRLVTLPPDSPRGGLLTQGTVLAVTSNPTRTSPVKRGLFILDNFLGTPPPPAPPNIPPLEDAKKNFADHDPSLREMLAVHRANPLCASCHGRMDPLGLALENFNAMGQWRTEDAKQPIIPAGQLITGEKFADLRELKHILTHERRDDFYRCLTEKLLTYALGRGLEYYDVETVDQIVAQLVQTDGKFSSLLNGVINSAPFQRQRNESDPAAPGLKTAATP